MRALSQNREDGRMCVCYDKTTYAAPFGDAMKLQYSADEARQMLRMLRDIFDIARIVDPVHCLLCDWETADPIYKPYSCYAVWNKTERCQNCVSMSALSEHTRKTKYEFVDQDVYHVTSKYLQIDGRDFTLEIVSKINDEVLLGAYGNNQFIERITAFNAALYLDPLTEVYNRKYLNNRPRSIDCVGETADVSLAMADVDDFKQINDTFGHVAGDEVLKALASMFLKSISDRRGDCVVRYGGDEFLLIFSRIPEEQFKSRMQEIVRKASEMIFSGYPGLRVSLSIGGVWQRDNSEAMIPELIAIADKRLYRAKHMGGNCVVVSG